MPPHQPHTTLSTFLALCLALGLASCGDGGPVRYEVEVIRTTYGVPHIVADDWGSAGYGLGYTYAQDNFCVVMREIVASNGESARYFLPGEGANLKRDFVWRYYNEDARTQREFVRTLPGYARQALEGYVAGLNRYFREAGVDGPSTLTRMDRGVLMRMNPAGR